MRSGLYDDERWCPHCRAYVWYIDGPAGAFCVRCSHRVRLFHQKDWRAVLGQKWHAQAQRDGEEPPESG